VNISVRVYDIFITHAKFEKYLEISRFLPVCKLNTNYHLGKIWTKIKNSDKI